MSIWQDFINIVDEIEGAVCNPSATTIAECNAAVTFIQAALVAGATITGFPALATINAPAIFQVVENGLCVATTDLANALSFLDALQASASSANLKVVDRAGAPVSYPKMPATRVWLATKYPTK